MYFMHLNGIVLKSIHLVKRVPVVNENSGLQADLIYQHFRRTTLVMTMAEARALRDGLDTKIKERELEDSRTFSEHVTLVTLNGTLPVGAVVRFVQDQYPDELLGRRTSTRLIHLLTEYAMQASNSVAAYCADPDCRLPITAKCGHIAQYCRGNRYYEATAPIVFDVETLITIRINHFASLRTVGPILVKHVRDLIDTLSH